MTTSNNTQADSERHTPTTEGVPENQFSVSGVLRKAALEIRSDPIQYAGCLASMVGAQLLALKWEFAPLGWVAFFIGNLFFITWGLRGRHYGIVAMQCYFFVTSTMGIYNHLL